MDWKSVSGILCDICGVLYDPDGLGGGTPIAGSVEAVRRLKAASFPLKFVTNESQLTQAQLAARLRRIGFDISEGDILSPVTAVRHLLRQRQWKAHLLVHKECIQELQDVAATDGEAADCVVIGDAGDGFSYAALDAAFQALMASSEPRLISLGLGRYYSQAGHLHLDVGAYAKALEFACSRVGEVEVVGKPDAGFFNAGVAELRLPAAAAGSPVSTRVAMVGDDIVSDVGGAMAAGLLGVQVRTGKFRPDIDEPHPTVTPSAYVDNLQQLVDRVLA